MPAIERREWISFPVDAKNSALHQAAAGSALALQLVLQLYVHFVDSACRYIRSM